MARVDFFVREDGEVLVNELNTIPGFTVDERLREACSRRRGSRTRSCSTGLIELALERHERRSRLEY